MLFIELTWRGRSTPQGVAFDHSRSNWRFSTHVTYRKREGQGGSYTWPVLHDLSLSFSDDRFEAVLMTLWAAHKSKKHLQTDR